MLTAGCAWRPLYGSGPAGLGAAAELSQISIPPPKTRLEQLVRNELLDLISPSGGSDGLQYRLEIVPTVTTDDVFVQTNTDVRRVQYQLNVNYRLFGADARRPLTEGNSFSIVSYTRVVSEFANIRAERDAAMKTARAVSEDIRTRLASYFASSG